MPMYEVHHYRKIATAAGLRQVAAHNMREKVYDRNGNEITNRQTTDKWGHSAPWYNPVNGKYNSYDYRDSKQVLKARRDRIQAANLKRKPQKNAAHAIEAVFSASPEFSKSWENARGDKKAWDSYLAKSREWVNKTFGKENVLHTAIHFDETTPHLHVLFVPIAENAKGELKYAASSILGGPAGLRRLQTEHHEAVGKKYGLERGIEGNRVSHQDLRENRRKAQEIENNRHLTDRPVKGFEWSEPKKPMLAAAQIFTATDGEEFSGMKGWENYVRYEKAAAYKKYIKNLEQQNVRMFDEVGKAQGHASNANFSRMKAEKELSRIQNLSPEELREIANRKEERQRRSHDRSNGITR